MYCIFVRCIFKIGVRGSSKQIYISTVTTTITQYKVLAPELHFLHFSYYEENLRGNGQNFVLFKGWKSTCCILYLTDRTSRVSILISTCPTILMYTFSNW